MSNQNQMEMALDYILGGKSMVLGNWLLESDEEGKAQGSASAATQCTALGLIGRV